MEPRSPDMTVAEWREVERAFEGARDDDREDLEARAALANEHGIALEMRRAQAEALRQP